MFLPFSARGKSWEPKADGLRRLAGIAPHNSLDPWKLASKVGLHILAITEEHLRQLQPDDRSHLLGRGRSCWSGGVYPTPLPDGTRLCLLNPNGSYRRNKITLMEEIAHVHLGHEPTQLILRDDSVDIRDYNKAQEQEAFGVGAAALLPWPSFFNAINGGQCVQDLAEKYDVTTHLIQYRIKICGASRLYAARQKKSGATA